ncbi:MAG TPA: LapA family protein [Burkholderiaceae bacterium]|nr:LapA family protein [Burkholderiaceae bacterium]
MRALVWLFRAFLFFVLFAFALNNQHEVELKWFFGYESRAPMVFIVLAAFALGCLGGALAMLPSWWRHRRAARTGRPASAPAPVQPPPSSERPAALPEEPLMPPRDGL